MLNKIYPIKASKQPLLWTQAIRQTDYRGFSKRNILLSPIISHTFPFKNHLSYLFDHIIIGSNPVLIALTLFQLHKYTLVTDTTQPIKIGIILTEEEDYWSYHLLEKEEFWQELNQKKKMGINFSDFLNNNKNIFQDKFQHQLTLIDYNFSIMSCRYDNYVDGYILQLKDKESVKTHHHSQVMPTVLKMENKLRLKYVSELKLFLNSLHYNKANINELIFPNKKISCPDNQTPIHLLLTNRVWLSSTPFEWLETKVNDISQTISYEHEVFEKITYSHMLAPYSNGSALGFAENFYDLEKQTLFDMMSFNIKRELLGKNYKYHD